MCEYMGNHLSAIVELFFVSDLLSRLSTINPFKHSGYIPSKLLNVIYTTGKHRKLAEAKILRLIANPDLVDHSDLKLRQKPPEGRKIKVMAAQEWVQYGQESLHFLSSITLTLFTLEAGRNELLFLRFH